MPVERGIKDYGVVAFCRLGVAGLSPIMPGTCGTLLAMLIAPYTFLLFGVIGRGVLLVILFVLGALASSRAEKVLGKKDPGEVVIDELVGYWLTLWLIPGQITWLTLLLAFILFRIFDMTKPWPINASEKWFQGGWGVMADDVFAGIYAFACLWFLHRFGIC